MLHITSLDDGIEIFKALGSDVRIQILNILLENSNMSMKDLAARLNITNGALTGHIKKLESCGLITTSAESVVHGNQKICSVHWDRIIIDLEKQVEDENVYNTEVKITMILHLHVVLHQARHLSARLMMQGTLSILTDTMLRYSGLQMVL